MYRNLPPGPLLDSRNVGLQIVNFPHDLLQLPHSVHLLLRKNSKYGFHDFRRVSEAFELDPHAMKILCAATAAEGSVGRREGIESLLDSPLNCGPKSGTRDSSESDLKRLVCIPDDLMEDLLLLLPHPFPENLDLLLLTPLEESGKFSGPFRAFRLRSQEMNLNVSQNTKPPQCFLKFPDRGIGFPVVGNRESEFQFGNQSPAGDTEIVD